MTNRVGMVRRENDRPEAIGSRGGLSEAEFGTQRSAHARIVAGPEADAWRMCATSRTPSVCAKRHLVTRRRSQRLVIGFHRPIGGAPAGGGQYAGRRVRPRVALRAVVDRQ